MKFKGPLKYLIIFFVIFFSSEMSSQTVPAGINYQGIARNASGAIIAGQAISVKVGIYSSSATGPMEWEETHNLVTNQIGLFFFVIGQGTSTGGGSAPAFSSINWGSASHFIRLSMDETGGSAYVPVDTMQFWSVPYAMYSGGAASTDQNFRLHQLLDADTVGVVPGYVLKYNGSLWVPAPDNNSDTALFAYNSNHSNYSDTASYSLGFVGVIDSAFYAAHSDTALYSVSAGTSVNASTSAYCDTATYAFSSGSAYQYWNLGGNSGTNASTNFLGTTDNTDLVFRTNNLERMRLTSAGKLGIGISAPVASLHLVGNDGLVAAGDLALGASVSPGAGTRMHWYPKKAAFRAGGVTGAQWDDANIGIYSFAVGNSTTASGAYSTTSGQSTTASGQYSIAMGYGCTSNGVASIALGSACNAPGTYSVAIGRACLANDTGAVCIGYHSNAMAKFSTVFGNMANATGDYSTAMGYYANTNSKKGSFVYADASSTVATNSTANNQFMVRASGGIVFYSNSAMTMGVTLPAGGGSWTSVSDRNKKENFKKENPADLLNKLSAIEITSWNYKSQPSSIRHIGPMAQDFYRTFEFGESDSTITSSDIDGINLIMIQALAKKIEELKKKTTEIRELKEMVAKLEKEKHDLDQRILLIEKQVSSVKN